MLKVIVLLCQALCSLLFIGLSPAVYGAGAHFVQGPPSVRDNLPIPLNVAQSTTQQYHLRMYNLHSGESLDVTYRVGNKYMPAALSMLNHFLRDHWNNEETHYDPHEFDVLHALMLKLQRPNGIIDVVCGYRSPQSNSNLREHSRGVAEFSEHTLGKAVDLRIPGVSTRAIQRAALSLHDGGVGFYPRSHFVHIDVGPVRRWTLR